MNVFMLIICNRKIT